MLPHEGDRVLILELNKQILKEARSVRGKRWGGKGEKELTDEGGVVDGGGPGFGVGEGFEREAFPSQPLLVPLPQAILPVGRLLPPAVAAVSIRSFLHVRLSELDRSLFLLGL